MSEYDVVAETVVEDFAVDAPDTGNVLDRISVPDAAVAISTSLAASNPAVVTVTYLLPVEAGDE